jgi:hypothetical protein
MTVCSPIGWRRRSYLVSAVSILSQHASASTKARAAQAVLATPKATCECGVEAVSPARAQPTACAQSLAGGPHHAATRLPATVRLDRASPAIARAMKAASSPTP